MIAIVGGGLAGLVAAYDLTRAGRVVTILEAARRLGGQIWTESAGGFVIERGAEGYAARSHSATALVSELDLTGRLVSQLTTCALVLHAQRLERLPVSDAARLAGIQADRTDFGHGIASFRGGTGELVSALAAAIAPRAAIRLESEAVQLTPRGRDWQIATRQGDTLNADAVILAVPAAAAARLVSHVSRDAARTLESSETVSSVSVSLACSASALSLPSEAGGFVSRAEAGQEGFRACDFSSAKFPGRAPDGYALLRAFFRPGRDWPLEAPDDRWVELAVDAIWPVLEIQAPPARAWVARWPNALPRYAADHGKALAAVTELLGGCPPLELAGAAYRASGIAGAIESARAAARSLVMRNT